jgi:hypothetical protein
MQFDVNIRLYEYWQVKIRKKRDEIIKKFYW